MAGAGFGIPITVAVSAILVIVYFSYRQTIAAYPQGAGSYTVAKQNLGRHAGLWAAVALMVDYTLNVAVGISAGIGALVSAFPVFQPYILLLCLGVLALLAFMNLRGLREAGLAFMPPTYLFVGCLLLVCLIGFVKTVLSGGHPQPLAELPSPSQPQTTISVWLFLKAFAAGCTAMTGVEAVSNGVPVFKEPMVKSARLTLTFIVAILIILLIGIAYLVSAYHITATELGSANYQSILSLVTAAVAGRGVFYYLTMIAVLLVLCLSANTSFADFPRVCLTVSIDGFLPASFGVRGRRLVYTQGIVLLTALAGYCTCRNLAFRIQRGHRQTHSLIRCRRLLGVYALPSRNGHALVKVERTKCVPERYRQWHRCICDRVDPHHCDRNKICGRSLARIDRSSAVVSDHAGDRMALS